MRAPLSGGDPALSRPLSVTYRAIESLKPDARNARTHSKRQIEQIKTSIGQFGFANPLLVDEAGVLIAGHGRLLAAKALNLAEVPTIELAGLSEAQKRALRLADNKIALNAGWDVDLLRSELAELSTLDVDLDLTVTGFSTGELDVLLSGKDDPDDDIIPPIPATLRACCWSPGSWRQPLRGLARGGSSSATSCSMARCSIAWLKPRSSSRAGDSTTTQSGRTQRLATGRLNQKP